MGVFWATLVLLGGGVGLLCGGSGFRFAWMGVSLVTWVWVVSGFVCGVGFTVVVWVFTGFWMGLGFVVSLWVGLGVWMVFGGFNTLGFSVNWV